MDRDVGARASTPPFRKKWIRTRPQMGFREEASFGIYSKIVKATSGWAQWTRVHACHTRHVHAGCYRVRLKPRSSDSSSRMRRLVRKSPPKLGKRTATKICAFLCPMSFRANGWKLLVLNWHPRRDLNPCYRRERWLNVTLTNYRNTDALDGVLGTARNTLLCPRRFEDSGLPCPFLTLLKQP